MKTVLLVEDNKELNEINKRALEMEGYTVYTAFTVLEARKWLAQISPQVILLDAALPDGNGMEFCGEIRDFVDSHILFLTSRTEHEDKLRGFGMGADDYITKPYKLDELIARVGAAMRRRRMGAKAPMADVLMRGALTLNVIAQQAFFEGKDLLLTQKEFALLLTLFRSNVVSKEKLYEDIWQQPFLGDGAALWKHISRLNKKLFEGGGERIAVYARRGEGYYLQVDDK